MNWHIKTHQIKNENSSEWGGLIYRYKGAISIFFLYSLFILFHRLGDHWKILSYISFLLIIPSFFYADKKNQFATILILMFTPHVPGGMSFIWACPSDLLVLLFFLKNRADIKVKKSLDIHAAQLFSAMIIFWTAINILFFRVEINSVIIQISIVKFLIIYIAARSYMIGNLRFVDIVIRDSFLILMQLTFILLTLAIIVLGFDFYDRIVVYYGMPFLGDAAIIMIFGGALLEGRVKNKCKKNINIILAFTCAVYIQNQVKVLVLSVIYFLRRYINPSFLGCAIVFSASMAVLLLYSFGSNQRVIDLFVDLTYKLTSDQNRVLIFESFKTHLDNAGWGDLLFGSPGHAINYQYVSSGNGVVITQNIVRHHNIFMSSLVNYGVFGLLFLLVISFAPLLSGVNKSIIASNAKFLLFLLFVLSNFHDRDLSLYFWLILAYCLSVIDRNMVLKAEELSGVRVGDNRIESIE